LVGFHWARLTVIAVLLRSSAKAGKSLAFHDIILSLHQIQHSLHAWHVNGLLTKSTMVWVPLYYWYMVPVVQNGPNRFPYFVSAIGTQYFYQARVFQHDIILCAAVFHIWTDSVAVFLFTPLRTCRASVFLPTNLRLRILCLVLCDRELCVPWSRFNSMWPFTLAVKHLVVVSTEEERKHNLFCQVDFLWMRHPHIFSTVIVDAMTTSQHRIHILADAIFSFWFVSFG
jgi:hypothetical protein